MVQDQYSFMSWDHPMIRSAMDLVVSEERGNSAFVVWTDPDARSIFMEMIFVLECQAPTRLHARHYLGCPPIRVCLNHQMQDCTEELSFEEINRVVQDAQNYDLLEKPQLKQTLIPQMIASGEEIAAEKSKALIDAAVKKVDDDLGSELQRLRELSKLNPDVRKDEIKQFEKQIKALKKHLPKSRLSLNAVRLIWKGPQL